MRSVDLSRFSNQEYQPGGLAKRLLWYCTNSIIFDTAVPFPSRFKVEVLRLFGAKVGTGVVIKPDVNIKYPWFLEIGNHSWIGQGVWLDNLAKITIHDHVSLSQGAFLLTGSHDYKKESFDLILGPIVLETGAWIGAKAIVCPGVTCGSHSVLAVGSVATKDLVPNTIYQGNPATEKRMRTIK